MAQSLGQMLREGREAKGLSIHDVSELTRIASEFLSRIEENDFAGVPGGIFAKGFVRSFARAVDISEEVALGAFAEQQRSGEDDTDSIQATCKSDLARRVIKYSLRLVAGLLALACVALVAYYALKAESPLEAPALNAKTQAPTEIQPAAKAPIVIEPTAVVEKPVRIHLEMEAVGERTVRVWLSSDGAPRELNLEPGTSFKIDPKEKIDLALRAKDRENLAVTVNEIAVDLPEASGNLIEAFLSLENIGSTLSGGRLEKASSSSEAAVKPKIRNSGAWVKASATKPSEKVLAYGGALR